MKVHKIHKLSQAIPPWQMTQQEFLDHHKTGHIPSSAYTQYSTLEGISWLGTPDKYPILLSRTTFGNHTIEFRQSGEKLQYVAHMPPDADGYEDILRDENGMAIMLTDEEMARKGLPTTSMDITAFDGNTPVGWASDEFGATGVWVAEPYQHLGIGTALLKAFHKACPERHLGQMTDSGVSLTRSYHKSLVEDAIREGKVVPERVLRDYPELAGNPSPAYPSPA